MKPATYNMLLEAASRYNILTLTTSCAATCVFCSHHQNPKEVEAYYINKLTKEEAENLVEFLDGDSKITIGESATRICEGEPFAFEYIMDILKLVRSKYPNTTIQITTSGISLDAEILGQLQELKNIELNISLNSCSEGGRKKLYGGKAHMQAVEAVEMIKKYEIPFNGSIVAMPHTVGWEDLEKTIFYLADKGAATVRVFTPGYTRYTKIDLPGDGIAQQLEAMALRMRSKTTTPVLVEPVMLQDLEAQIEGVIDNSPAHKAGFKAGDRIIDVNGKSVYSRVDAYYKVYDALDPEITFVRQGQTAKCTIKKAKQSTSGLVFQYDIEPQRAARIRNSIDKFKGRECLMPVSKLGYGVMKKVLEDYQELDIRIAENSYFGGNIMCAGLLVLQDIEDLLKQLDKPPQVVFLPQIMMDERGRDLTGRNYIELEQEYGVTVVVL